jgi:hypothetical protein
LYSNDEEVIFDVQRPAIINGIDEIVTRGDLLSRTISLSLPALSTENRRTDDDIKTRFDKVYASALGAIFDAVSSAIRNADSPVPAGLPRMADAVVWVTGAEPALGWPKDTFRHAYEQHTARLSRRAIDADFLGSLLVQLGPWRGTATQLLGTLEMRVSTTSRSRLPATSASLGQKLERLIPDLRAHGIEVTRKRDGHAGDRLIVLEGPAEPVSAVSAVSNLTPKRRR